MQKKQKKRFRHPSSSIVPQGIPVSYRQKYGWAVTSSDKDYYKKNLEIRRSILPLLEYNPRRVKTVMAFCRNYYVKYQELPKLEDLRRIFKF